MQRTWIATLLGMTSLAVGCGADMGVDAEREGNVATVQQAEVLVECGGHSASVASIKFNQELLVTDLSVVNDTPTTGCRTSWNKAGCATNVQNKWHFWYLMQQMAGTNGSDDLKLTKFVLRWLESIENWPHPVNGQTLDQRPGIRAQVINPWMSATNTANGNTNCAVGVSIGHASNANCRLRPEKAPFRLLAVVNRMDLRTTLGTPDFYGNISSGADSGEGRLVFGLVNQTTSAAIQATVIFEYKLPTFDMFNNPSAPSTLEWANRWHALGGTTTFGATFNNQLTNVTEGFVRSGVNAPGLNQGSAISQVRFNERNFDQDSAGVPGDERQWSLREFKLGCYPGDSTCSNSGQFLIPSTVAQSPANAHNNTALLDTFLNNESDKIILEKHLVPDTLASVPFKGAESRSNEFFNGPWVWSQSTPLTNATTEVDTVRLFALSTCNGCHYRETETNNFHINPRSATVPAVVSQFLLTDPTDLGGFVTSALVTGKDSDADGSLDPVAYNEPRRRVCEFLSTLAQGPILSNGSGRPH